MEGQILIYFSRDWRARAPSFQIGRSCPRMKRMTFQNTDLTEDGDVHPHPGPPLAKDLLDDPALVMKRVAGPIAIYCKVCQTWLGSRAHWDRHRNTDIHKKNVKRLKRRAAREAAREEASASSDPVPAVRTEAWNWLEEGKALKEPEKEVWESLD